MKSAKLNLLQNFFNLYLQKAGSLFGRKCQRLILTNSAKTQTRSAAEPNGRDAVHSVVNCRFRRVSLAIFFISSVSSILC